MCKPLIISCYFLAALGLASAPLASAAPQKARSETIKQSKSGKTSKAATKVVRKSGKKNVARRAIANARSNIQLSRASARPMLLEHPGLQSAGALIINQLSGDVIYEKNADTITPMASITKLMTAMVVLESGQRLSEPLEITEGDIDRLKGTGSRLSLGTTLTREDMLHLALMSSENRAASALARNYPGGEAAFVEAMNVKARLLGLWNTRFHDSTGLNPGNVSSPRDLAKLVAASASFPLIREFSTSHERYVDINGRMLRFGNTNSLVRSPEWAISVSKTGYISEAGRCLVMQTWLRQQPVVMVLMDSYGRYTRTADAKRVRKWLEQTATQRVAAAPARIGG